MSDMICETCGEPIKDGEAFITYGPPINGVAHDPACLSRADAIARMTALGRALRMNKPTPEVTDVWDAKKGKLKTVPPAPAHVEPTDDEYRINISDLSRLLHDNVAVKDQRTALQADNTKLKGEMRILARALYCAVKDDEQRQALINEAREFWSKP